MARMFLAIARCRKPVIGRIHGAALGGGSGLTCAVDVAVATADTKFGFTEARLGIIPAVISPFVVRRIGDARARVLFVTGERFDGREAERIGLVHRAVPAAELDATVEGLIAGILACGPLATQECKALLESIRGKSLEEAIGITAVTIARIRSTSEALEGMSAFLAKRPPAWTVD
jgi:methylglutaconyl-CoA hydratase